MVEYKKVLEQEEVIWLQKSRSNWTVKEENNKKKFHITALNKKKRNRIDILKINGT